MPATGPNHFLGLRPDAATIDRLAALGDRLRAWGLPARWTRPEDLHLTLCFLGPLDAARADTVRRAVAETAAAQRTPELALAGLGAAGGRGEHPRAVFAAVADPEEGCDGIRRDLCDALDRRPEDAFRPHLTLCRPEQPTPDQPLFRDWPHLLEAHGQADWGACTVESVVLWRRSGSGASRYEALAEWPLHRR
jgi:2'-5' RNA ligase